MIENAYSSQNRASVLAWSAFGASGLLLAVSGAIWWAWDWNPGLGKLLVLAGVLIAVVGLWLSKRATTGSARFGFALAILVLVVAIVEIIAAIATIASHSGGGTL